MHAIAVATFVSDVLRLRCAAGQQTFQMQSIVRSDAAHGRPRCQENLYLYALFPRGLWALEPYARVLYPDANKTTCEWWKMAGETESEYRYTHTRWHERNGSTKLELILTHMH